MSDSSRTYIERLVRAAGVPGCAVATVTSSGEASYFFGKACLDPPRAVRPDTVFHLFSGTKLYTAAAVMLLVERGAVALDHPVTDYLPDLGLRYPVTVRQLASHSSGLSDTLRGFLSVHPGDAPAVSTSRALSRYRLGGGRPPGGRARYANVNYAVLGELVTRLSGTEYTSFVRQNLLAPLGARLDFSLPPGPPESLAVGYLSRWSPVRLALRFLLPDVAPWIFGTAAGNLVSLRDYNPDTSAAGGVRGPVTAFLPLLAEMLSEADGVLTAASKREMLTVHADGAAGVVSRVGVGLGWKRGRVADVDFWNHEGGGAGFCSETRIYPDSGLGIVVLMNRSQSAGLSRVCHRISERLRVVEAGDPQAA